MSLLLTIIGTIWILKIGLIALRSAIHVIWLVTHAKRTSMDLQSSYGEWALVTGSTDGIGLEFAKQLAQQGFSVVIFGRSRSRLDNAKSQIQPLLHPKKRLLDILVDFNDNDTQIYEDIGQQLEEIKDDIGILINNAGVHVSNPTKFLDTEESTLISMINVNVTATLRVTRLVLPLMIMNRRGLIVNVSSIAATRVVPYDGVYGATKAFMNYFSDTIRMECSQFGIHVQTLMPFFVITKMVWAGKYLKKPNMFFPSPEMYARSALNTLGQCEVTTGFWFAEVVGQLSQLIPDIVYQPVAKSILSYFYGMKLERSVSDTDNAWFFN